MSSIGHTSSTVRASFPVTRQILTGSGYQPRSPVVVFDSQARTLVQLQPAKTNFHHLQNAKPVWRRFQTLVSMLLMVVALLVATVVWGPSIYWRIFPAETIPVMAQESGTPLGGKFDQGTQSETVAEVVKYQPPVDPGLPTGEWLVIPRIGVRSQLQKTASSNEALDTGIWWVPDFGNPGDTDLPMILVAHRYGYKWWWQGNDYWKYHSFYLLPDLEPGDTVEVIADQRKWRYEIYAGAEGEEITDYDADLILYTCKYLNSTIRHFRYARLIDPTVDSQQVSVLE